MPYLLELRKEGWKYLPTPKLTRDLEHCYLDDGTNASTPKSAGAA